MAVGDAQILTREAMYEVDMKAVVAEAVAEALEAVEDRKTQREESVRYEKIELARWAVEQVCATYTTIPTIGNITTLADQIIAYIETKGQ